MLSEVFNKFLQYVGQPFASWNDFLFALAGAFRAVFELESKTSWLYLLTSLAVVGVLYFVYQEKNADGGRKTFWEFAFPRDVYLHDSAIVDYKFFAVDLSLKFIIYIPLIAGVSQLVYRIIEPVSFGVPVSFINNTNYYFRLAIITIFAALITDFGLFFAHYIQHKIPFLWSFHEVHHSAEVLTPVTVYRVHPVEELINGLTAAVLTAVTAKTYSALTGDQVTPFALFGLNLFAFLFFAFAFQLRHSHVWLSYGRVLNHVFISPAQHQVHHSIDTKHWNKNYGFTFAFWDWLFGCLYVPKNYEKIEFGVPNVNPRDFSTVGRLYYLPFIKSARICKRIVGNSFGKIRSLQIKTTKSV